MVKTVVLVSGGGANLQALIDTNYFGELVNCDLAAVVSSSPDAYALTRAGNAGIRTYVVDRAIFPNDESFSDAMLKMLRDLDAELVILAGFSQPLSFPLLREYSGKIISVYPALLPAFFSGDITGSGAAEAAVNMGVRVTGATSFFVMPDGTMPIILQKSVEVLPDDTPQTLERRITNDADREILPATVSLFCDGRLTIDGTKVIIAEKEKA